MSALRNSLTRHSWWIAFVWVTDGLITAAQVVGGMAALGRQHDWTAVFLTTAAAWLIWAAATPLILALSRRFPLTGAGRRRRWRNVAVHLVAALGISVLRIAWSAALEWAFNPLDHPDSSFRHEFLTMVYMQFHTGLIIYGATVAIDNTIDSIRRLAR